MRRLLLTMTYLITVLCSTRKLLYAIFYARMIAKTTYLLFLPNPLYNNFLFLKVRQSALKIGLKAEFCM